MKNIIKMSVLLFALVLSVACEKDEDQAVFADDATVAVTLSDNTLVLEKDNASETALTITWEIADANVVVAPSYTVQFAYGGKTSNVSAESSPLELTTEGLNTILTNLGVLPNQATDVTVTVTGALSEYFDLESATNTLKVTTYEDVLDLSTAWGVVGSITGWGGEADIPFWQVPNDASYYVAYFTVETDGNEIKFRKDSAWAENYGDDSTDGTLEAGAANIPINAGTYRVLWNINDNTYTIEEYYWGIIGSGIGGWGDSDDVQLNYNGLTNKWEATGVATVDGEIKFRFNHAWAVNYGGADGVLESGGANIAIATGTYTITADFSALIYTIK